MFTKKLTSHIMTQKGTSSKKSNNVRYICVALHVNVVSKSLENALGTVVTVLILTVLRSAASSSTCLPGSTNRTCSKTSRSCLCLQTPSPQPTVWRSSLCCAEAQSAKPSEKLVSALGGLIGRNRKVAGSSLSSGYSVRCLLTTGGLV